MVVSFPSSYCSYSPTGGHYSSLILPNIWRCKYCWAVKWLPSWNEVIAFSEDIRKMGIQAAYQKWLQPKSKVRELLTKLEEIRLMKELMPATELAKIVAVIVLERETVLAEETDYGSLGKLYASRV